MDKEWHDRVEAVARTTTRRQRTPEYNGHNGEAGCSVEGCECSGPEGARPEGEAPYTCDVAGCDRNFNHRYAWGDSQAGGYIFVCHAHQSYGKQGQALVGAALKLGHCWVAS